LISKKVREFFSALMEAKSEETPVIYDSTTEQYTGVFNQTVVDKFIKEGVLELVTHDNGLTTLLLNGREDFLSGFAAGINEAMIGHDQYYADYNANPFAFSIGFEHYQAYAKKRKKSSVNGVEYFCHGITCEQSGETYYQR
jgi:hypothetical protein